MSLTPPTPDSRWATLRQWGANAVIIGWLLVLAHQVGPFVPQRMREWPTPTRIARGLGIWQSRWEMFAPHPDNQNQHIEAIITFADGTRSAWRTPDWRSIDVVTRFGMARQIKVYDSLWATWSSPVWPAFADYLSQEARAKRGTEQPVTKVEFYAELAPAPPVEEPWRSWKEPAPVKERHLYYVKEYP